MTFENGITLGDGSIYFAGFGKYQPNLGFIVSTDDPHYNKEKGRLDLFVVGLDLDEEGGSLKLREEHCCNGIARISERLTLLRLPKPTRKGG